MTNRDFHAEHPARYRGRTGLPATPLRATVIGLGGVGRQVALQLAALGVPRLQLIDSRTVGRATHAAEGYAREDIGRPRAHAAAQSCHQIHPQIEVHAWRRRPLRGLDLRGAVFLCADSAKRRPSFRPSPGDRAVFVARCCVDGTIIRLDFTLGGDLQAERMEDRRSGTTTPTRRTAVAPMHFAGIAASLAATEFVRFSAGKQPKQAIRLDVETLRLDGR